jgi:predicted ATP-binding protein involved in virulence
MAYRLTEFQIDDLFGLYNHRIKLNSNQRITVIIGPNGRGKTVCLKFIEALFRRKFSYFNDIPFSVATFSFSSGHTIKIERTEVSRKSSGAKRSTSGFRFLLGTPGAATQNWSSALADPTVQQEISRYLPGDWRFVESNTWIDQTDGEELTTEELVARYRVPNKMIDKLQQKMPEPFNALISDIDCHLIETQRLLVLPTAGDSEGEMEYSYPPPYRRRVRETNLAIQEKARKLRNILQETLTAYANLSQSLDRSFPLRVFEAQGSPSLSQTALRQELRNLDDRREALMSAGILDTQYEAVTLRSGDIEPGVAMALEIYVKDAVQKLNVFSALRSRLDLFKELIERRFIDKALNIDRESGFKIKSKTGLNVPLDKLSSGEQHQLILVFDLLFEVKTNSLILIDEPELSLHVAWQKTFIESLQRIIALNAFDVLLATHSPAVVARHFDLVVELGPVDE